MILEMKVPSPGESISEVEIAQWLVSDGDYVEKDQTIAEVDSDKATLDLPAEKSGIITLKANEGDTVAVGAVVCHIDTKGIKEKNSLNNKVEKNITEAKHIPTGFMLIKRNVFESLFEAFPSTKYTDDVNFLTEKENEFAYALFDCGVEEGHYLSEDWMFCHRWTKLGGKIYVDISINLSHTGIEDYNGSLMASLL